MRTTVGLKHKDGKRRLKISLSLTELAATGKAMLVEQDALQLQTADQKAAEYTDENWFSGALSGAQYALQKCGKVSSHGIRVYYLRGTLGEADIEAISWASAECVFRLLGEKRDFAINDWAVEVE